MAIKQRFRGGNGPRVTALMAVYVVLGAGWIAVRQFGGLPAWSLVGLAIIPFVAPAIVDPWLAKAEAAARRRATIRAVAPASKSGKLPRAREVGLTQAGVHASRDAVDYVPRDTHSAVVHALRIDRRVLIVGPSAIGKSRLALEAIRLEYGTRPFWSPPDYHALRRAVEEGLRLDRAVVWLDDIDRFVGEGGLTVAHLEILAGRNNIIAGTIRSGALSAMSDSNSHKPLGWDVPAWFGEPIWLTSWTPEELERAQDLLGEAAPEQASEFGLGAYLAGAPGVVARLRIAETEQVVTHAIARLAADWRRIGLMRPLPTSQLVRLLTDVLPASVSADDDAIAAAIEWGTAMVNQTVALLQVHGEGVSVPDFVIEHFEALPPSIGAATWDAALAIADDDELVNLATQALTNFGRFDIAETAFRKSRSPSAAVILGYLLLQKGEDGWAEADALFRSNLQEEPARAAVGLAILLEKQAGGNDVYVPEADVLYQKAADLGDALGAFNAGMNALRRTPQPDPIAAERYLRLARDRGHRWGAGQLGSLLVSLGRFQEAGQLLREAASSATARPSDLVAYGGWLHRAGMSPEGIDWVEKAAADGSREGKLALINLLLARSESGDWMRAEEIAREVCTPSDLGAVLLAAGKRQEAFELIEAEIEKDNVDCMYLKAKTIAESSAVLPPEVETEVRDLLRRAAERGHNESASLLGMLMWNMDRDFDNALPWLRQGCNDGDPQSALSLASIVLARFERDDISADFVEECRRLLSSAMESNAPDDVRAAAATNLGFVSETYLRDSSEAERLYRYAATLGRRAAMRNLADLLGERGGFRNRIAARRWRLRAKFAGEQNLVPWVPRAHLGGGVLVIGGVVSEQHVDPETGATISTIEFPER